VDQSEPAVTKTIYSYFYHFYRPAAALTTKVCAFVAVQRAVGTEQAAHSSSLPSLNGQMIATS